MLNDDNTANILIVDDLPENLLALNALIRGEDRVIIQASRGEHALDLLLENDFAVAILDVQMPGMNGFELAELMRGTAKTRHIPIIFVTAAGKESNYAFKGYETGAVDFLYKPLDIDAVRGKVNVFVELFRQRNETRRQVQALEKSRQEQEVLMLELETAKQQLQGAVRMRDDFMSMVAHELRTPLSSLALEAQLRKTQLERKGSAMFDEAYLEAMLARDTRQIHSMVRLIDDMMDVTRIQSNRLSIRPCWFELTAMLARVIVNLSNQAAAAGCELTLEADQPVTGFWDEFRIEQVVTNLLTNALRYGNAKPVNISLELLHECVRINVRDDGRGISASDLQRIFEQFERVAHHDGSGGLGLGLFITKQLVEAHGGSVSVQSQQDKGTIFTVTLPLNAALETDAVPA